MGKRRNSFFLSCAFIGGFTPWESRTLRGMVHFINPAGDNAGAGGGGNDDPAAGGGNDDPAAGANNPPSGTNTVSRSELTKAIQRRDKATAVSRQLLEKFDIDPAEAVYAGAGTEDDPYRIENLDELLADAGATGASKGGKGKPAAGSDATELRKLRRKFETLEKEKNALTKYIQRNLLTAEIRAAAVTHGAFNSDKGKYNAIVRLVAPQYAPSVAIDPDTKEVSVTFIGRNEDGEILEDEATGEPLTPSAAVKLLLSQEPNLKSAPMRGGPGAGGANVGNNGGGAGGGNNRTYVPPEKKPEQVLEESAQGMFGGRPPIS